MKNSNWLSTLSISLPCLLLVALGSATTAAPAQQSDDDGGPGNQECDSTSVEMAAGPLTGTATSTVHPNHIDHGTARRVARSDLEDNIGDASGIVCKHCENGRRCTRTTILTAGTVTLSFTEIAPVAGTHDGGWKCDAVWTGKYKINCRKC